MHHRFYIIIPQTPLTHYGLVRVYGDACAVFYDIHLCAILQEPLMILIRKMC